jgi:hypothetical protein
VVIHWFNVIQYRLSYRIFFSHIPLSDLQLMLNVTNSFANREKYVIHLEKSTTDNTRVRIFFFCRAKRDFFSPEFNIRLYDKNSESDYFFFLHQNQNIFFSNIVNQVLLRKKRVSFKQVMIATNYIGKWTINAPFTTENPLFGTFEPIYIVYLNYTSIDFVVVLCYGSVLVVCRQWCLCNNFYSSW